MRTEVLIVGAGPTGLVLALWLAKLGVLVEIIDKTLEPGTTSRALAVHARTLELYRQADLADAVVERGYQVDAVNLWVGGANKARISLADAGAGLSPYPFLHIFPQDQHERLLIERLETLGVRVARGVELLDFNDAGDRVVARLRTAQGETETCEAQFIAGCDGAHSRVREGMQTGFPGGTYDHLFYVADVDGAGPAMNGELNIDLDEADFLAIFPLARSGRARLIGAVKDDAAQNHELRFDDVSHRAIDKLRLRVERVNWFSTYHVHHRVTEHFRKGRAFLLGDAAHIHSPAGGQGMNTGIGDAINLAWKLQAALAGRASENLLDSYEEERIGFARRLVQTTDRVFSAVSAEGAFADFVRMRLAPLILPQLAHFETIRDWLFSVVSQIEINYRQCAFNEGRAGTVHGGDRLPWVSWTHGGSGDNYATLKDMNWQAHVYGTANQELRNACGALGLPLTVLPWRQEFAQEFTKAGFSENALFLLRPDSYVAFADASAAPENLDTYFAERTLRPSDIQSTRLRTG